MPWNQVEIIHGEPPASFVGKPPGYAGYYHPAVLERSAVVDGQPLPLYTMSDGRGAWPSRANVARMLEGFSCRAIEGGLGVEKLQIGDRLVEVVSPQAIGMAVGLAVAVDRITAERAAAILEAVGA